MSMSVIFAPDVPLGEEGMGLFLNPFEFGQCVVCHSRGV
jgi:hypothetical protein